VFDIGHQMGVCNHYIIYSHIAHNYYFMCWCQALGVFGLCQIHAFIDYVHSRLTKEQFNILFRGLVLFAAVIGLSSFGVATALGSILPLNVSELFC